MANQVWAQGASGGAELVLETAGDISMPQINHYTRRLYYIERAVEAGANVWYVRSKPASAGGDTQDHVRVLNQRILSFSVDPYTGRVYYHQVPA